MIGAGTVINPIIKIVTTVAILAAVYLFFVKPALDTTDNITNRAFDRVDESLENSGLGTGKKGKNDIERSVDKAIRDANRQVEQALKQSGVN